MLPERLDVRVGVTVCVAVCVTYTITTEQLGVVVRVRVGDIEPDSEADSLGERVALPLRERVELGLKI